MIAALGSCLLLGLRHGFDYDHLAAISDITAVERNWRRVLRLGLPQGVDRWTERLVGLTLIVLGAGVVAGILRKDAHSHPHGRVESRLAIAINGLLWLGWRSSSSRPISAASLKACSAWPPSRAAWSP